MSEANKKNSQQDRAIHEYLQSLLSEVPDESEGDFENKSPIEKVNARVEVIAELKPNLNSEPETISQGEAVKPLAETDEKPVVLGIDQLVAEVPEVITQTATEVVSEVKVESATEIQTAAETRIDVDAAQATQSHIPDWAETRFQCLLFKVSGLSLAVPLVKLNSVIPWDENITSTPNQTDWYLGLVQHLQNQIKVIDTALLVMPENRRASLENDAQDRLSHILLVDDYKWGLACSSIGDVIWLNQDEVKWRKDKSNRAWLSGTSLEHLCAIMDTEVFAQMLTESS